MLDYLVRAPVNLFARRCGRASRGWCLPPEPHPNRWRLDRQSIEQMAEVRNSWRGTGDRIHTWVNGVDRSLPAARSAATFALSGIGVDDPVSPTNSSGWDDAAFEYVVCRGATPAPARADVRAYLRSKWELF